MENKQKNDQGVALPLVLIFFAAFSVLALGLVAMGTEDMKSVSNFEHGVRAFYLAEAAANEAAGGYLFTGEVGPYEYGSASAGDSLAVAKILTIEGQQRITATGRSSHVTKHVQMDIQVEAGSLRLSNWRDYGLSD